MELIKSPYPPYKVWDIVQEYPPMEDMPNDPAWQSFLSDIRTNGQQAPIVLWQDAVVDGFHRLKACGEIGITPLFNDLGDIPEEEMRRKVASFNLHRRHLTPDQKAIIAAKAIARPVASVGAHILKQQVEARARQEKVAMYAEDGLTNKEIAAEVGVSVRQVQQDKKEVREGALDAPMPTLDDIPEKTWADVVADPDVTRDTVAKGRQVLMANPDLADEVAKGKVSLNDAVRSLKMDPEAQARALQELEEAEGRKVNYAAKAKEAQREILRERALGNL